MPKIKKERNPKLDNNTLGLKQKIKELSQKQNLTKEQLSDLLDKIKKELNDSSIMSYSNFSQLTTKSKRTENSITIENLKQIAMIFNQELIVEFIDLNDTTIQLPDHPFVPNLIKLLRQKEKEILALREELVFRKADEYFERGLWFHDMYVSSHSTEIQKEIAYKQITKYYLKALAVNPLHHRALSNYGSIELREARKYFLANEIENYHEFYKRAVYFYLQAEEADPNNIHTLNNKVNMLLTRFYFEKTHSPEQALQELQEAKLMIMDYLNNNPEVPDSQFYYALAALEANLGNLKEALQFLIKLYQNGEILIQQNHRFRKKEALITDSDLAPLHQDEEFINWMKEKIINY